MDNEEIIDKVFKPLLRRAQIVGILIGLVGGLALGVAIGYSLGSDHITIINLDEGTKT